VIRKKLQSGQGDEEYSAVLSKDGGKEQEGEQEFGWSENVGFLVEHVSNVKPPFVLQCIWKFVAFFLNKLGSFNNHRMNI
jgi:hypothetical protein